MRDAITRILSGDSRTGGSRFAFGLHFDYANPGSYLNSTNQDCPADRYCESEQHLLLRWHLAGAPKRQHRAGPLHAGLEGSGGRENPGAHADRCPGTTWAVHRGRRHDHHDVRVRDEWTDNCRILRPWLSTLMGNEF